MIGGWQDGELPLARQWYERLPPDSLLLADGAYYCIEDRKMLDQRGIGLLFRIGDSPVLKPIQRLADGSYLAMMYGHSYSEGMRDEG